MGAPSPLHERRVDDLATLATLAGFTACLHLPWRLRPDVARVCIARRAVFLGDAKATETPGCAATYIRLHWYATALRTLEAAAQYAVVALAVENGRIVRDWERTLVGAFRGRDAAHLTAWTASWENTAVVSLKVAPARRHRPT